MNDKVTLYASDLRGMVHELKQLREDNKEAEATADNWREAYAEAMKGWGETREDADRLRELLEEGQALRDELLDHHCSGMCDYYDKKEESEHWKLVMKINSFDAKLAKELHDE